MQKYWSKDHSIWMPELLELLKLKQVLSVMQDLYSWERVRGFKYRRNPLFVKKDV